MSGHICADSRKKKEYDITHEGVRDHESYV